MVLLLQFVVEDLLSGTVVVDALEGQEGLKAIAAIGRGLVAEEGQAVGVDRHRAAMAEEGATEVFEMMPGSVGWDESGAEVLAGMVVDGEEEGLLVVGWPPGVDGGVVLPEFADPGAFPAPLGLGEGKRLEYEVWEVRAGVSGDGLAIPMEEEAGGELVGDELEVRGALEGQEGLKEASDLQGPTLLMIAPGDALGEALRVVEPCEAKPEEVRPADPEKLARAGSV